MISKIIGFKYLLLKRNYSIFMQSQNRRLSKIIIRLSNTRVVHALGCRVSKSLGFFRMVRKKSLKTFERDRLKHVLPPILLFFIFRSQCWIFNS